MADPLRRLKCAYFTDQVQAPDQTIDEILDFREFYKNPLVETRERRVFPKTGYTLRWKNEGFNQHFKTPHAFYRVRFISKFEKNISKVICYPIHFETAAGKSYEHLAKIFLSRSSQDLLSKSFKSIDKLLIGDIIAVSDIYSLSNQIIAGKYVIFERKIEKSDALIFRLHKGLIFHNREKNSFVASSSKIPMDRELAEFGKGIDVSNINKTSNHAIGQCEIFLPVKGAQRFAANFQDDVFFPDPQIRAAIHETMQNSFIYREEYEKNHYPPVVINCSAKSFYNPNGFTTIDNILRAGNQRDVQQISSLLEASLTHYENTCDWLDIRNHPLEIINWRVRDANNNYQIRIDFRVKDLAWSNRFPKKAMLRVFGIVPYPLDIAVLVHIPKTKNDKFTKEEYLAQMVKLECCLRILDNIEELDEIDVESIGRKMFDEVVDGLERKPQLIYSHLIHGDKGNVKVLRNFNNFIPNNVFNDLMRYWRDKSLPSRKFEYNFNVEQKNEMKRNLEKIIKHKPTKEQTKSAYFTIFSKNPIIAIEAPVGGGKTTLLSGICLLSAKLYGKTSLIVCESNGAVISNCRKLKEFGAKNDISRDSSNISVLRITSSIVQKRNCETFLTDFDLPTVAEQIFVKYLANYDGYQKTERSMEELNLLTRTHRMLNYMHKKATQSEYNFENAENLRNLIGNSINMTPEDPENEKIRLVLELLKPNIILGTARQIEQLLDNHKIKLNIDQLFVDKASSESTFSIFSIVSMISKERYQKFPKIILIGDSKQFQPLCCNPSIEQFYKSSLETIGNSVAQVKHHQMFRCQPDACELIRNIFYGNWGEDFPICKSIRFRFVDPDDEDKRQDERFSQNLKEVEAIWYYCQALERNGVRKEDVMILAFYNGQVGLMKRYLRGYTILMRRLFCCL